MSRKLEQLIADNHAELYALHAITAGGYAHNKNGLRWTNAGSTHNGNILFPETPTSELLNEIMDDYAVHPPGGIGCWSLLPAPANLEALLLARGFQTGWQPCWMVLELPLLHNNFKTPEGLIITNDNTTPTTHLRELPYAGEDTAISRELMTAYPERAQRFLAWMDGEIVAQSAVFFSEVAGIYNVGVLPGLRGKGIGKAVTVAACEYARQSGYQYATLNATPPGQHIYTQMGFKKLGSGITWWMPKYREVPERQTAIAEAVGLGQIDVLETLAPEELQQQISNGMTLLQLATQCKQRKVIEWLIAHEATLKPLDAWDLGLKDRATAMLAADPDAVNILYMEYHGTLLHIAALRNDIDLARLALRYHPDLTIADSQHCSTPEGWAMFFRRKEILDLLKSHAADR
ncbi:GNAT family N-acetyltransferase [uncultured Chitinophaga sp.]|uniref:GNAT family N-acetyltransferase n=1 Tax=uncultured Chitinophaga sp. TaxID=339340 RepID=UPI0025D8DD7D|nr:GNAT family N-acetyltransferase [uncultured Chitinophaga sp.]